MSEIDSISEGQPDAVERTVTVTEAPGGPHVVTTLSQEYRTSAADLWQACTTADRLARWFAPVSGDLRLGGRYRIEGNASGTIEECEPPARLRVSWEFQESVSWVTVRIEGTADGARLTLTHTGDIPPDFWATYGPGAAGVGWDLAFLGLALHLGAGTERPPEAGEWAASEPARRFVVSSSRHWASAWVAAGAVAGTADAAERATTAFYTGQEGL